MIVHDRTPKSAKLLRQHSKLVLAILLMVRLKTSQTENLAPRQNERRISSSPGQRNPRKKSHLAVMIAAQQSTLDYHPESVVESARLVKIPQHH